MSTWRANPDLVTRLISAQNHPAHNHIDVLTFAAFCDDRAELERHVEYCEKRAAEYVAPARRRSIKKAA